jgi:putative oxidoreductase
MAITIERAARRSTRSRDWRRIGMWILQSVSAAAFAAAGGGKVWGTSQAPTLFDSIDQALGLSPLLRYALGIVEMVGGVALLDVDAAGLAAVVLSIVTLGAIATHVLVHTNPALSVAMLAATLLIAWVRRDELLALVRRGRAVQ